MLDFLYYSMVAAFFTHELDAVKRHEWRVLPILRNLPEKVGEQTFIWLHVPLFILLLLLGDGEPVNGSRIALSVFAVVHVWLHWVYRKHVAYEFNNPSSWGLIILTGVMGAAYLVASLTTV